MSTLSTEINTLQRLCNIVKISLKNSPLFSIMSTLSTAVNSYQHLSTKTLYSNNEHIPKGLLTKNYVNTVNRDQHSATAMQQSQIQSQKQPNYFPACQHCQRLSTAINTCQQRLYIAVMSISKRVYSLKTMSTLSTEINTLQRLCNRVKFSLKNSPTSPQHVNNVNRYQQLSTSVQQSQVNLS